MPLINERPHDCTLDSLSSTDFVRVSATVDSDLHLALLEEEMVNALLSKKGEFVPEEDAAKALAVISRFKRQLPENPVTYDDDCIVDCAVRVDEFEALKEMVVALGRPTAIDAAFELCESASPMGSEVHYLDIQLTTDAYSLMESASEESDLFDHVLPTTRLELITNPEKGTLPRYQVDAFVTDEVVSQFTSLGSGDDLDSLGTAFADVSEVFTPEETWDIYIEGGASELRLCPEP